VRIAVLQQDEILGLEVVELVHLIFAKKNRQVPFKQVYEDFLAGAEHRPQSVCLTPSRTVACIQLHHTLHRGSTLAREHLKQPTAHTKKWGDRVPDLKSSGAIAPTEDIGKAD
jgi:hypothetical protein